ncbi:hypothetical protein Tco_0870416 [Tanacetum coccineum]
MALLLAEERFLKIKQTMEEEQNQPGVIQELLLKLMDDLQFLKECQKRRRRQHTQRSWERFGKITDALTDEQYRQEDIQELISKLLEDVRNISEELSEYINCPSWNRPTIFNNDDEYTIKYSKPKAITPDLPTKEPIDSLIIEDEHLDTIPATESDEVIKSSVEELVPIPSESEGISDGVCDVPLCDNPTPLGCLNGSFVNFIDLTMCLLSHFLFPSRIVIHSLRSLILVFLIQIEPDQGGLISIVISNNHLLELPEFESFYFDLYDDPSFPRPPPEPPDVEISLIVETDAPVINNFDKLNEDECFDPGEMRLMLKLTIPSHLLFGLFSRFSLTLRFLPYFSPSRMRTPFLTLASPLGDGGILSGWNFHVRILQKSQENGQNRTNTDTGTDRLYKSRENAFKVNQSQLIVNIGQLPGDKTFQNSQNALNVKSKNS